MCTCCRYNHNSGTWALGTFLTSEREKHSATLLTNNHVAIIGGRRSNAVFQGSAEIYQSGASQVMCPA